MAEYHWMGTDGVEYVWVGIDGDWSDGSNWSDGVPPPANGTATFQGNSENTVYGFAGFESISIQTSQLTLAGDFAGYDSMASITDSGNTPSHQQTLTVAPWGYVTVGTINLDSTALTIQGGLLVDQGSVQTVSVTGPEGFLGVNSALTLKALDVSQGAIVQGNLVLGLGDSVKADDLSSLGTGIIDATGSAAIAIVSTLSTSETVSLANTLTAEAGQTLTVSATAGDILALTGATSGAGTVAFTRQSVDIMPGASIGGTLLLSSSILDFSSEAASVSSVVILEDSQLTIDGPRFASHPFGSVRCTGTFDKVYGGNANLSIAVADDSQLSLFGSGANTVLGGNGAILDFGGHQAVTLQTDAGNSDLAFLGQDSSGAETSHIAVVGDGNCQIVNTTANATLDGSMSSGANTFFGGTGTGATTVYGGAGVTFVTSASEAIDVFGGTGDLTAFAGSSGSDRLVGGTGNNTLVGGAGTALFGMGAGNNLLVGTGGGCLLDLSGSSGSGVIFINGNSDSASVIGGSGSDVIVVQDGNALITPGTGQETIWAGVGTYETVRGALDQVTIVTNGGGSSLDISGSTGASMVFAQGGGANSVIGGNGQLMLVSGPSTLYAQGGSGTNVIWGGSSGHDTIIGGSGPNTLFGQAGALIEVLNSEADYLNASGANVTLNGGGSNGWVTYACEGDASGTVIYTGSGTSLVNASGVSAATHVIGGNVTLNCGNGATQVFLDATSVSGTLNIYGFDPGLDSLSVSGAAGEEQAALGMGTMTPGDGTSYSYGNETVIFHTIVQSGG